MRFTAPFVNVLTQTPDFANDAAYADLNGAGGGEYLFDDLRSLALVLWLGFFFLAIVRYLLASMGGDSAHELKAAQQGALVYARIMEILPFDRGNGLVARLAASHLMTRAGSRRPILVGGDAGRLEEALPAAFQLQTEPLTRLLDDAAERALDVLIGALS